MEKNILLQELYSCSTICNMCFTACLNEKEVAMMARCIELDRECSDMCLLTASAITRDSENKEKYVKLCGELCAICAEECEKHDNDHCQKCAEKCRRCAEMCNEHAAT